MARGILIGLLAVVAGWPAQAGNQKEGTKVHVHAKLAKYIQERIGEFEQIPEERQAELKQLAGLVRARLAHNEPCNLTFICTHNSRRSHISQIWAATAAAYYSVNDVRTYSGGTESTAFNPRAVAALERAGFDIDKTTNDDNPVYHVRYVPNAAPLTCFSKVYNQAPNPTANFCAVMTCSHADEACPTVSGASDRIAITYDDPKVADRTPGEAAKYDERCRQIARELLYAFSLIRTAE